MTLITWHCDRSTKMRPKSDESRKHSRSYLFSSNCPRGIYCLRHLPSLPLAPSCCCCCCCCKRFVHLVCLSGLSVMGQHYLLCSRLCRALINRATVGSVLVWHHAVSAAICRSAWKAERLPETRVARVQSPLPPG
jgi:hypothetical protein